jgi:hypothetical protein
LFHKLNEKCATGKMFSKLLTILILGCGALIAKYVLV